nr:FAD-dependent thymidylate synthase [uncultured Anaeromusa sp.]
MRVISPSFELLGIINPQEIIQSIENYGRVCYKSESGVSAESAEPFIRKIIKSGHESVIEHEKVTARIICDRGVTHEIVRHRIASYSQESTRYCNYSQDKFGKELTFIRPCYWEEGSAPYSMWVNQMKAAEDTYIALIESGAKPEQARSVLPNSLKTEIIVTMNLREWRHFFKLRTAPKAHPQMREVSIPLFKRMRAILPAIFDDIQIEE